MPTYTVRAPNGRTYKVQGPAGATQQQIEAAILDAYPEAAKPAGPPPSRLQAFQTGVEQTKLDVFDALMSGARAIGLVGPETPEQARQRQNFARDYRVPMQNVMRQRPNAALAGRVVASAAATEPLIAGAAAPLAALSKVVPALAPVARTVATSGMATGIKTTTPVLRAVDAALRIGGGAATGAASSALLNQQIDEGAAVGAAVSMIPLVGRYGVGPVWDALRGRLGEARAARVFRQALGANVDAAREAFRKGGKGTASQILARVGIDADTFFATGQLVAKSGAGTGVLDDIARGQQAAREEVMNAAAGASTRTGSRRAAIRQRGVTTATATPIMEEALGAVNVNTQNALAAQRAAQTASQQADVVTSSGIVPRMRGLETRSREQLDAVFQNPAFFTPGRTVERIGEVAEQAGTRADEAIAAQLGLREAARTAEQRLADLTAAGVKPLNVRALSGRLRQMASVERANPEKAGLLSGFADQLDELAAANGGILDARDLYELRKDAGGIVERLLQGRTPDAIRKRTAEVIGAVRPMIDNAIESAGGKRWREYLDTFATGMDEARRVELSDYARKLATDQPEQFQHLMRGDRPDIVERFFGKGRFDINEALGPKAVELAGPVRPGALPLTATPAGPSRLPAMQGVADELGLETIIKNQLTPGAVARATNLLAPPVNLVTETLNELPFSLGRPIGRPLELIEERITAPRTTRALERGFASPQGALKLLDYAPAGQRGMSSLESLSPGTLRMLQQFGVQLGREEPINSMRR